MPLGTTFPNPISTIVPNGVTYADSEGAVMLKIKWISSSPIPNEVRVRIHAPVIARFSEGVGSTGEVSNELSGATYEENNSGIYSYTRDKGEIRTLPVNENGEATVTLSKKASAVAQPHATGYTSAAYADAKGISIYIDSRSATIIRPVSPRKREVVPGESISRSFTLTENPSHDVFTTGATMTVQGEKMTRVSIPIMYDGANVNYATWRISTPIFLGYYSLPSSAPIYKIDFSGHATSESLPGENYNWSMGSKAGTWTLPSGGSYSIQPTTVTVVPFCINKMEYSSPNEKAGEFIAPDSQLFDLNFTYTWADGTTANAKRKVVIGPPYVVVDELSYPQHFASNAPTDWMKKASDNSMWLLPGHATEIKFSGQSFDFSSVSTFTGITEAGGNIEPLLPSNLAGRVGLAAAIAASFNLTYEMTDEHYSLEDIVPPTSGVANFSWYLYINPMTGQQSWMTGMPSNVDGWEVAIKIRAIEAVTLRIVDRYDEHGFVDRVGQTLRMQHNKLHWRKLYYYRQVGTTATPGSGSGGGTPGGGS